TPAVPPSLAPPTSLASPAIPPLPAGSSSAVPATPPARSPALPSSPAPPGPREAPVGTPPAPERGSALAPASSRATAPPPPGAPPTLVPTPASTSTPSSFPRTQLQPATRAKVDRQAAPKLPRVIRSLRLARRVPPFTGEVDAGVGLPQQHRARKGAGRPGRIRHEPETGDLPSACDLHGRLGRGAFSWHGPLRARREAADTPERGGAALLERRSGAGAAHGASAERGGIRDGAHGGCRRRGSRGARRGGCDFDPRVVRLRRSGSVNTGPLLASTDRGSTRYQGALPGVAPSSARPRSCWRPRERDGAFGNALARGETSRPGVWRGTHGGSRGPGRYR